MKTASWMLCLVTALALGACVYDAPFVEEAVLPVDPALTGVWQEIPEEEEAEDPDDKMVILPFSANKYVVICSPGEEAMYFRAYPVRIDDLQLIQIEWLGVDPEKDSPYHLYRTTLNNGTLTVAAVNDEIVDSGITNSKALRDALISNRANPALFHNPVHYHKLTD